MARRSREEEQAQEDYYRSWVARFYPDGREHVGCRCGGDGGRPRRGEVVTITPEQYAAATRCAERRLSDALARGLRRTAGLPGENDDRASMLADHVLGAAGEIAYAVFSGERWECKSNVYRSGDDVGGVQVRTRSRSHYDLNIKQVDAKAHADDRFVLVLGAHGGMEFRIVGWISCKEAMEHDEWRQNYGGGRAAWFVPQEALHSMEEATHDTR